MSEKLKECPFCGSSEIEIVELFKESDEVSYMPQCKKCKTMERLYHNKDEALKGWNTRFISKQDVFENLPKCETCDYISEECYRKSHSCADHSDFNELRDEFKKDEK